MSGIKRFITYIYVYENGNRGINTGFAKIEIRGNECRVEIHLRTVSKTMGNCKIHLFTENGGGLLSFLIGEMKIMNGNGDYGTIIKADKIGASDYSFNDMEGLVLFDDAEQVYMTRWAEGKPLQVTKENIRLWEPPRFDREENREPQQEERQEQKEDIVATEMPVRNIYPQYSWTDTWERMKQTHPCFTLPDENAECVRIELRDLREMPRKYWYLGNNSFLLHGFFNYHYLVVGKTEEDRWFIGIPGIYQQQERIMASIFGFPEFMAADRDYNGEEKTEAEPLNRFGYWYHTLEES